MFCLAWRGNISVTVEIVNPQRLLLQHLVLNNWRNNLRPDLHFLVQYFNLCAC